MMTTASETTDVLRPDSGGTDECALMAAVATLTPAIHAAREATERGRHLPADLVRMLAHAGLFKLFAPRSLGGSQLDPLAAARVVEAVSVTDPSVGWSVMIASQWSWFTGYLSAPVAAAVIADPAAVIAGQLAPGGEAVAVASGYRVSGRWPFNSGADHATWFAQHVRVAEGGTRLVFLPRTDVDILDTWHVLGLRGTASHDVVVRDVLVPAERSIPWPPTHPVAPGPLYHPYGVRLMFVTQAAQAFGVARSAIDAFVALATGTTRHLSATALGEQPTVQATIARAAARLAAARAYLAASASAVWDQLQAGREPTVQERAHLRLAITDGIGSAVQVVDAMFTAAGSRAIFTASPLEQYFRDVHTASAHVQATPAFYQETGRVFLGLELPRAAW